MRHQMDLARGYRARNSNSDTLLILKLPDMRTLRIISRSLFLSIVLITLPSIGYIIRGFSVGSLYEPDLDFDVNDIKILPNLFLDLVEEGLVKKGHKGLIIASSDVSGDLVQDFSPSSVNGIDLVIESDIDTNKNKNVIQNGAFDFVFVSSFQNAKVINGVLKTGGIVVSYLTNNPVNELQQIANYKLVYLRRINHTIVAMRKISSINGLVNSSTSLTLCGITSEAKKAALRGLEKAFLEPPRKELAKSSNESRKIKFLPDLFDDSLENYPRRIFISDGKISAVKWFQENYPTRDQEFEVYDMDIEIYDPERLLKVERPCSGVSDWLRNHVREEDYVVMKAEALVVEEMIKEKTICLVDELFLECKYPWEDGGEENGIKRPYWQCLALYGKLRGDGVAVHQWLI